ncbi:MAG: hypothetical protein HQM09_19595 [Candidatus Riflebacteria bacterium]|nr:hypothetical protein [Candidatus Riflebacteria bacterium]
MSTYLLLSPHYPPRLFPFATALRNHGFVVVGIGDAQPHELKNELRENLAEYLPLPLDCYSGKGVFDEYRYDVIYRAVARLVAQHGRLDGIESFNEYWLPLESRLREDFNVPGPRPAELEGMIRKSRMKLTFASVGVPVVPGKIVQDYRELLNFLATEKTIIVKPDIGVGAFDTHKVASVDEAEAFWAKRDPNVLYFMERFIQGPDRELLSFDGIADGNGDVAFAAVHPVNDGLLEIVSGGIIAYHNTLQTEISLVLRRYGEATVKAFGLRRRFFHIEFFRVGEIFYGLELNARPPGVLTLDMMNHSRGIDIWKAWAAIVAGKNGPIECPRDLICFYTARVNRLNYKYSNEELMSRLGNSIVFSHPMDSPVMGDFGFLAVAATHDERRRIIEEISLEK